MNKEKHDEAMQFLFKKFASMGGKARAAKLTKERKSEIARMGGKAKGKKK